MGGVQLRLLLVLLGLREGGPLLDARDLVQPDGSALLVERLQVLLCKCFGLARLELGLVDVVPALLLGLALSFLLLAVANFSQRLSLVNEVHQLADRSVLAFVQWHAARRLFQAGFALAGFSGSSRFFDELKMGQRLLVGEELASPKCLDEVDEVLRVSLVAGALVGHAVKYNSELHGGNPAHDLALLGADPPEAAARGLLLEADSVGEHYFPVDFDEEGFLVDRQLVGLAHLGELLQGLEGAVADHEHLALLEPLAHRGAVQLFLGEALGGVLEEDVQDCGVAAVALALAPEV